MIILLRIWGQSPQIFSYLGYLVGLRMWLIEGLACMFESLVPNRGNNVEPISDFFRNRTGALQACSYSDRVGARAGSAWLLCGHWWGAQGHIAPFPRPPQSPGHSVASSGLLSLLLYLSVSEKLTANSPHGLRKTSGLNAWQFIFNLLFKRQLKIKYVDERKRNWSNSKADNVFSSQYLI